jgi:hypothetical protein
MVTKSDRGGGCARPSPTKLPQGQEGTDPDGSGGRENRTPPAEVMSLARANQLRARTSNAELPRAWFLTLLPCANHGHIAVAGCLARLLFQTHGHLPVDAPREPAPAGVVDRVAGDGSTLSSHVYVRQSLMLYAANGATTFSSIVSPTAYQSNRRISSRACRVCRGSAVNV